MAWETVFAGLKQNFALPNITLRAIYVLFIAIAIELLAWWLGRAIEKAVTPYISNDSGRSPAWRVRRRTTLRQSPKWLIRAVLYTIGAVLVFDVFGVPVLPLSLAIGAVVVLVGAGIAPIFRDIVQGYILLAEDTLAPGDAVEINGRAGSVEKINLRGTWLRGHSGRTFMISNRDITDVEIHHRAVEAAPRDFSKSASKPRPQSDVKPKATPQQNPSQRHVK